MAKLLQISSQDNTLSIYAVIRWNGKPWNGSQFTPYVAADYSTYNVDLTQQGDSGYYSATFPPAIPVGLYHVTFQARNTPDVEVPEDTVVYQGMFDWPGTDEAMSIYPITVDEFKAYFDRDFTYGLGKTSVRDSDISKAIVQAMTIFNRRLFVNDAELEMAYEYATAHFLVIDIQMAGGLSAKSTNQGLKSTGSGIVQSKTVGQVSLAYQWPESIINSPALFQLLRTPYGEKYLQIIAPRLVGNILVVSGNNDTDGQPLNVEQV